MADDRPAWARRMYNERQARGWSQADVIRAMRAHAPEKEGQKKSLPDTASCCASFRMSIAASFGLCVCWC
jgi:hypothetical protein